MIGVQGAGAALGRQPPQLRRVQGLAAQLGHLIRRGHGAQHGKA